MLVEDDKSLREIYSIRLVAEGYNIVSAGDGEEALALAAQEKPDLIISDVMMPKISGFDMLDILRSQPETKDIKVIMMTALSSEDQRLRGEALGADRYLVKSQVGIEDVVNTVHEILGDQPNASAHTSMSTAAVMPAVEQAAKEAAAAEQAAPVNIDAPTTAETTIAPQNSTTPAPDVNQQMPSAPQQVIPDSAQTPPTQPGGANPVNFNQAPAANPAVATVQPAAGAIPQMPVNPQQMQAGRKSTGGERVIAPIQDRGEIEERRLANERRFAELLGEPVEQPQQGGPQPMPMPQQMPPQAPQPVRMGPPMTLSAAVQGNAMPTPPMPGSTATLPGQPAQPSMVPQAQAAPQPMPQQMPQQAPQAPAPVAPTMQGPQQVAAQPSPNSPQQASPQATQPVAQSVPENTPPAPKPAAPAKKSNPVANMSPEMIAQVVKATKVRSDYDEDEVVESIKPAYITELEEDLSADMDALGGDKNSMAARMFDELKDDEMTIAASQMERPVVKQQEEEVTDDDADLPDALKDVLSNTDNMNPNISYSNGDEEEDGEEDASVTVLQAANEAMAEGDGMGPTEPEMTIDGEG